MWSQAASDTYLDILFRSLISVLTHLVNLILSRTHDSMLGGERMATCRVDASQRTAERLLVPRSSNSAMMEGLGELQPDDACNEAERPPSSPATAEQRAPLPKLPALGLLPLSPGRELPSSTSHPVLGAVLARPPPTRESRCEGPRDA